MDNLGVWVDKQFVDDEEEGDGTNGITPTAEGREQLPLATYITVLMVGVFLVLSFAFLLPLFMKGLPDDLIQVYIAYLVGVALILGVALITSSKKKALLMVLLLLAMVFLVLTLLLGNYDSSFNMLAPLSETEGIQGHADSVGNVTESDSTASTIKVIGKLLWIVDLAGAFLVLTCSIVGVKMIIQVVKKTSSALLLFPAALLMIALLVIPHLLVSAAGISTMAGNAVHGTDLFIDGMELIQRGQDRALTPDEEARALAFLEEAAEFLALAATQAQALEDLKTFTIEGFLIAILVSMFTSANGWDVMNQISPTLSAIASLSLAVGPIMLGLIAIRHEAAGAIEALGGEDIDIDIDLLPYPSGIRPQVENSSIDEEAFDIHLVNMQARFGPILDGLDQLRIALGEIGNLKQKVFTDISSDFGMAFEMTDMLDETLDAIEMLMSPYDSPTLPGVQNDEPFLNLLYASLALAHASETIGDSSNFVGVLHDMQLAEANLTIVNDFVNEGNVTTAAAATADEPWQRAIPALFRFLKDATAVAMAASSLGVGMAEDFTTVNETIADFQNDQALNQSDAEYVEARTQLAAVLISSQSAMVECENDYEPSYSNLDLRTNDSVNYEYLTDPAKDFVDILDDFDFQENINTLNATAGAMFSLMWVLQHLRDAKNQSDAIGVASDSLSTAVTELNATAADEANTALMTSSLLFNTSINEASLWIENINGNVSRLPPDNSQLNDTADALSSINAQIPEMSYQIGMLYQNATLLDGELNPGPPSWANAATYSANIATCLANIETCFQEVEDEVNGLSVGDT